MPGACSRKDDRFGYMMLKTEKMSTRVGILEEY
jgi:hypothetical protein